MPGRNRDLWYAKDVPQAIKLYLRIPKSSISSEEMGSSPEKRNRYNGGKDGVSLYQFGLLEQIPQTEELKLHSLFTVLFCFCCFTVFGHNPGVQGLFLAMCSGVTPGRAQRILWC